MDKLSDLLDDKQKKNKVKNLLQAMSREQTIRNTRSGSVSWWELSLDEKSED